MKTNIEAFKALIKRYEAITLEEVEAVDYDPTGLYGNYVACRLTGYGQTDTCSLCISAKLITSNRDPCCNCIIKIKTNWMCTCNIYTATYDDIAFAGNAEELLKAFKDRANYLKTLL